MRKNYEYKVKYIIYEIRIIIGNTHVNTIENNIQFTYKDIKTRLSARLTYKMFL